MISVGFFVKQTLSSRMITLRSLYDSLSRSFSSSQSVLIQKDAIFAPLTAQDISPKTDDVIAGRKWLPGSHGEGFPKFLGKPRQDFPHALQMKPPDQQYSILELGQICRDIIENDLSKYGALLFRGMPLTRMEDFSEFSQSVGYKPMDYTGGSANRKELNSKAKVYTANDDPSAYTIELHNELAYAPVYPKKLSFFCLQQPDEGCGGYTVLCDGRELLNNINPDILNKLEEKGVRYWYRVPDKDHSDYRYWQEMFGSSDKKKVEQFLAKDGFDFSWDPKDDSLQFWINRPAFLTHPESGKKLWFNHVYRKHLTTFTESPMCPLEENLDRVYIHSSSYGDGSDVEPEVLQHIRACAWQHAIGFQWKSGDVLFVDNFLVLHGRLGFKGNRKILANLMAN